MVIDKWTRTSNSNASLSIPLLEHKSKETFVELKRGYERLKQLNHNFLKIKNPSLSGAPNIGNNNLLIRDYLEEIKVILTKLKELLSEKNFYKEENYDIYDDIEIEFDIFIENVKQLGKNKNVNYNIDINSYFNKNIILLNEIYKTMNKDKVIEDISFQNEQNRIRLNINPNIDRGHINILTKKREYHNSMTFEGRNVQYTVEQDSFSNIIKIILFFLGMFFILFICYICLL